MSSINTNSKTNRTKKKGVAFGLIGAIALGGLALGGGGTWANLNQTISDGEGSSRVYSEAFDQFGFSYHKASQKFDADISVTDIMGQFERNVKTFVVQNDGDIAAQYAFYPDPVSMPALDANPIFDETFVIVQVPTDNKTAPMDQWTGTLREFTQTAFVTNDVLQPEEAVGITVQVLSPNTYTWSSEESAAAVDIAFGTKFTFNQLTNPVSSPLYEYATKNGAARNGYLKPDLNPNFANQLNSSMTMVRTLPSADVAGITL
jgi:hypothetical protein